MAPINRVKVIIDNIVYELSSSESVEYIQSVANYIDRKIKSIYSVKSEGSINPSLRTLFVALNIADDLFKEKDKVKTLEREASVLRKDLAAAKERIRQLESKNRSPNTNINANMNTKPKPTPSNTERENIMQDKIVPIKGNDESGADGIDALYDYS